MLSSNTFPTITSFYSCATLPLAILILSMLVRRRGEGAGRRGWGTPPRAGGQALHGDHRAGAPGDLPRVPHQHLPGHHLHIQTLLYLSPLFIMFDICILWRQSAGINPPAFSSLKSSSVSFFVNFWKYFLKIFCLITENLFFYI